MAASLSYFLSVNYNHQQADRVPDWWNAAVLIPDRSDWTGLDFSKVQLVPN